ncbi:24837_t:CDS:2, partial [Gigaspora margarita]
KFSRPQSRNSRSGNSQEPNSKKSARRLSARVWIFFDKGVSVKGHYKDIIDIYTNVVTSQQSHNQAVFQKIVLGATLNKKKHTLTNSQTSLSEFVEVNQVIRVNQVVIQLRVCYTELRPGYQPPSRQLFAGQLLNTKIIKVNQNIINILEKANNLTLSLDGRTSSNKKSLWNFVIHTSSR